jgi:hypothetical protein
MCSDPCSKSPNQMPWFTDWRRYDTPTVIRKHGREFLERFWRKAPVDYVPDKTVEPLATIHGGNPQHGEAAICLRVELHLARSTPS